MPYKDHSKENCFPLVERKPYGQLAKGLTHVQSGNMGEAVGAQHEEKYIANHLAQLCGVSIVPAEVFGGKRTKGLDLPEPNLSTKPFSPDGLPVRQAGWRLDLC